MLEHFGLAEHKQRDGPPHIANIERFVIAVENENFVRRHLIYSRAGCTGKFSMVVGATPKKQKARVRAHTGLSARTISRVRIMVSHQVVLHAKVRIDMPVGSTISLPDEYFPRKASTER
jgi:hypothetical protein